MSGAPATTRIEPRELPPPRYGYGGDDFVFVDLDQEMSFEANLEAQAICQQLGQGQLGGIVEICPGNASYLVRIDPEVLHPDDLIAELKSIAAKIGDPLDYPFQTRIVDVPVLYDDPWTRETLMRFRDRHQNPTGTDLEYVARINGLTREEFVERHHGAPYYVTMVGFVPGTPWCFQMRAREQMLQMPKYIRPRTDTPALAVAQGGAFACIYPVRGPGGFQLFGIAAAPIFDPRQELPDFADSVVFLRPGDILKFRSVEREEYDTLRDQVEKKTFRYHTREVVFEPRVFFENPEAYNEALLATLHGD